jgi:hypothetical protein
LRRTVTHTDNVFDVVRLAGLTDKDAGRVVEALVVGGIKAIPGSGLFAFPVEIRSVERFEESNLQEDSKK